MQRSRNPVASFPPHPPVRNHPELRRQSRCPAFLKWSPPLVPASIEAGSPPAPVWVSLPVLYSQRPPRRIFTFSNWFPCPHGRDVSHRVQYSLLRRFNLARMNIERGPIEHAEILLRRHRDNSQLWAVPQKRVAELRPLGRFIECDDQQIGRNLAHPLCYLRLVCNLAYDFDAGLIREG